MRRVLALLLLAAPALAGEWREMQVDPARLAAEVERAVRHRWGRRLREFQVELAGPRLVTDGERIRARFDGLAIVAQRWYLGDMPVRGRIDFGPGEVDYAKLGVGDLGVVGELHGRVRVTIDHAGMAELLAKGGFEDVGYEWVEETEEFVLWGWRPIKVLFFKVRPRIKVRLRVHLEGRVIEFRGVQIFISAIPRFIERIAERRINKRLQEKLDLQKDYDKLARHGIRAAGGHVTLKGADGAVILEVEVPGDRGLDEPAPEAIEVPVLAVPGPPAMAVPRRP